MIYRQGDVLIEQIKNLPKNVKQSTEKRIILAYGEVTGHCHEADIETCTAYVNEGGELFLDVETETEVTHQEHNTLTLPPGVYRITHQREYSPEEIKRVRD
jgi:hypothetical protein